MDPSNVNSEQRQDARSGLQEQLILGEPIVPVPSDIRNTRGDDYLSPTQSFSLDPLWNTWRQVNTIQWGGGTTDKSFKEYFRIQLSDCLKPADRAKSIEPFSFLRFDSCDIRLTLIGQEHASGMLGLVHSYELLNSEETLKTDGPEKGTFKSRTNKFFFADMGGSFEFKFPFKIPQAYIPVSDYAAFMNSYMGYLYGYEWVAVTLPVTTIKGLQIIIESRFVNARAYVKKLQVGDTQESEQYYKIRHFLNTDCFVRGGERRIHDVNISSHAHPVFRDGEMDVLMQEEMYVNTMTISTTNDAKLKHKGPVVPGLWWYCFNKLNPTSGGFETWGFPRAMRCMCNFWSGDLYLIIRVSKPATTNCVIAVCRTYDGSEVTIDNYSQTEHVLIELKREHEFVVKLTNVNPRYMKRTFSALTEEPASDLGTTNGEYHILEITKPVYSSVNASDLKILTFTTCVVDGDSPTKFYCLRSPLPVLQTGTVTSIQGTLNINNYENVITLGTPIENSDAELYYDSSPVTSMSQAYRRSNQLFFTWNPNDIKKEGKNRVWCPGPIPVHPFLMCWDSTWTQTEGAFYGTRGDPMPMFVRWFAFWNGSLSYTFSGSATGYTRIVEIPVTNTWNEETALAKTLRFMGGLDPMQSIGGAQGYVQHTVTAESDFYYLKTKPFTSFKMATRDVSPRALIISSWTVKDDVMTRANFMSMNFNCEDDFQLGGLCRIQFNEWYKFYVIEKDKTEFQDFSVIKNYFVACDTTLTPNTKGPLGLGVIGAKSTVQTPDDYKMMNVPMLQSKRKTLQQIEDRNYELVEHVTQLREYQNQLNENPHTSSIDDEVSNAIRTDIEEIKENQAEIAHENIEIPEGGSEDPISSEETFNFTLTRYPPSDRDRENYNFCMLHTKPNEYDLVDRIMQHIKSVLTYTPESLMSWFKTEYNRPGRTIVQPPLFVDFRGWLVHRFKHYNTLNRRIMSEEPTRRVRRHVRGHYIDVLEVPNLETFRFQISRGPKLKYFIKESNFSVIKSRIECKPVSIHYNDLLAQNGINLSVSSSDERHNSVLQVGRFHKMMRFQRPIEPSEITQLLKKPKQVSKNTFLENVRKSIQQFTLTCGYISHDVNDCVKEINKGANDVSIAAKCLASAGVDVSTAAGFVMGASQDIGDVIGTNGPIFYSACEQVKNAGETIQAHYIDIADAIKSADDTFKATMKCTRTIEEKVSTIDTNTVNRCIEGITKLVSGDYTNAFVDNGIILISEVVQLCQTQDTKSLIHFTVRLCAHLKISSSLCMCIVRCVKNAISPVKTSALQSNLYLDIGTTIFSIIVMVTVAFTTGIHDIEDKRVHNIWERTALRCREIANIRAGITSTVLMFKDIKLCVTDIILEFFSEYIPQDEIFDVTFSRELDKLTKEFHEIYPTPNSIGKAVLDKEKRDKVADMYKRVCRLREDKLRVKETRIVLAFIHFERLFITAVEETRSKSVEFPMRYDPLYIVIKGAPGIGKSDLAITLAQCLNKSQGYPEKDIFSYNHALKFMDNWDFNNILFIDDVDQNPDSEEAAEFVISMKSNVPFTMNMASLAEKGRQFTSTCAIGTTNILMPTPKYVADQGAYLRRRDILVEMSLSGKQDYKYSGCTFQVIDPRAGTPVGPSGIYDTNVMLTIQGFLTECVYRYSTHLQNQMRLMSLQFSDHNCKTVIAYTREQSYVFAKDFLDNRVGCEPKIEPCHLEVIDANLGECYVKKIEIHERQGDADVKRVTYKKHDNTVLQTKLLDEDIHSFSHGVYLDETEIITQTLKKSYYQLVKNIKQQLKDEQHPVLTVLSRVIGIKPHDVYSIMLDSDKNSDSMILVKSLFNVFGHDEKITSLFVHLVRACLSAMYGEETKLNPEHLLMCELIYVYSSAYNDDDLWDECMMNLLVRNKYIIRYNAIRDFDMEYDVAYILFDHELIYDSNKVFRVKIKNFVKLIPNEMKINDQIADLFVEDKFGDIKCLQFLRKEVPAEHRLVLGVLFPRRKVNGRTYIYEIKIMSKSGHWRILSLPQDGVIYMHIIKLIIANFSCFSSSLENMDKQKLQDVIESLIDVYHTEPIRNIAFLDIIFDGMKWKEFYIVGPVLLKQAANSNHAVFELLNSLGKSTGLWDPQVTTFSYTSVPVTDIIYTLGKFDIMFPIKFLSKFEMQLMENDASITTFIINYMVSLCAHTCLSFVSGISYLWNLCAKTLQSVVFYVMNKIFMIMGIDQDKTSIMGIGSEIIAFLISLLVCYMLYTTLFGFSVKAIVDSSKDKCNESKIFPRDKNGALQMSIQDMKHLDLPNDGNKYLHTHQCTECGNIYGHIHKKNTDAIMANYGSHCYVCRTKKNIIQHEDLDNSEIIERYSEENKTSFAASEHILKHGANGIPSDTVYCGPYVFVDSRGEEVHVLEGEMIVINPLISPLEYDHYERQPEYIIKKCGYSKDLRETTNHNTDLSLSKAQMQIEDAHEKTCSALQSLTDDVYIDVVKKSVGLIKVGNNMCHYIGIESNIIMANAHLFCEVRDNIFPASITIPRTVSYHSFIIDLKKDVYFFPSSSTEYQRDVCFIIIRNKSGLPNFPNNVKRFIKDEYVAAIEFHPASLMRLHGSTLIRENITRIEHADALKDVLCKKKYWTQHAIRYKLQTFEGTCGVPIIVKCAQVQGGHIVGIHMAGLAGGIGYGELITHEEVVEFLQEAKKKFKVLGDFTASAPDLEHIKTSLQVYSPNEKLNNVFTKENYYVIGELDPRFEPNKTTITYSLIFDEVFTHTTEPAVFSAHDPRNELGISPKVAGATKFVSNQDFPDHLFRIASDFYIKKAVNLIKTEYPGPVRELTWDEVVNGVQGFVEPIKMDSSAGFPFENHPERGQGVGKRWCFDQERLSNAKIKYTIKPWLQDMVDEAIDCLDKEGWAKYCYYKDVLKDEKRPLAKIKVAKTRMFNCANIVWYLIQKRYFGWFQGFLMYFKHRMYNTLGANMHGADATSIANFICEFDNVFDSDVEKFDSTVGIGAMNHFYYIVGMIQYYCNITIDPNKATHVNRMTQLCGQASTNVRIHVWGNVLYSVYGGIPSGEFITSMIGTVVMCLRMMCCWLYIMNESDISQITDFDKHVRNLHNGDDIIVSVSPKASQRFNALTVCEIMKLHGIVVTPPTKKEGDEFMTFKNFKECQFLKCHFVQDERYPRRWHAQMAMESPIQELTNWVRTTLEPEEALISNLNDALRFMYAYGEDAFHEFERKVLVALDRHMLKHPTVSFYECDLEWKKAHDIVL